jgi:nifR3 family TIM-barrel protein
MGEAARKIIDWKQPDFIDINFGCPVNKVVAKNGGSSLLKDCPLLASVAREVAKAVPIPVTAKMRIGWDADHVNAVEVARILEDCGMQAIAVHGRTRAQGYTGLADWDVIGQVADAVKIPVIGNGDIASGLDVEIRRAQTNVKGIMIGRAAMANPWVFQRSEALPRHRHACAARQRRRALQLHAPPLQAGHRAQCAHGRATNDALHAQPPHELHEVDPRRQMAAPALLANRQRDAVGGHFCFVSRSSGRAQPRALGSAGSGCLSDQRKKPRFFSLITANL